MKQIFKYSVQPGTNIICAKVVKWLNIGMQAGAVYAWGIVDEDAPEKEWDVKLIGTGWEFEDFWSDEAQYLNTVIDEEGYVWHGFAAETCRVPHSRYVTMDKFTARMREVVAQSIMRQASMTH